VDTDQSSIQTSVPEFIVYIPGSVRNLNVQVNTTLRISWEPPQGADEYHPLLRIRSYSLEVYRSNNIGATAHITVSPDQNQQSLPLPNNAVTTSATHMYIVTVMAVNDAGSGDSVTASVTVPGTGIHTCVIIIIEINIQTKTQLI